MGDQIRAISYGGGVQSTALVVLAAQGTIDFPLALFANVGEQSEPWTIRYVHETVVPWAAERGVEVCEVRRRFADGRQYQSLDEFLLAPEKLGLPIPFYGSNAGAPGRRACTHEWKIKPILRELRARGASAENPALTALGISVDELERAKTGQPDPEQLRTYPLLDLRLTRSDCEQIIRDAGLPVPRKSSCDYCPYHSMRKWRELRRDEPDRFEFAAHLEDVISEKRTRRDLTPIFLTKTGRPLREVVDAAQDTLPGFGDHDGPDECDSGYCFT